MKWRKNKILRFCPGLCLLGSGIVAATQYFGNPIYCDFNGNKVDSGLFNAHCWIHGTKAIGDQLVDGCVVSKVSPAIFIFTEKFWTLTIIYLFRTILMYWYT